MRVMAESPAKRDEAGREGHAEGKPPAPAPRGWSFRKATLTLPIKPSEHVRLVWQFFVALALIVVIFVAMLYVLVFRLDRELVVNQVASDTDQLAAAVQVAWNWNVSHGGVYVLDNADGQPAPESAKEAGNAEGTSPEGTSSEAAPAYRFINHAQMLSEMSEFAGSGVKFDGHLIGVKPNTHRPPRDEWEASVLSKWRTGSAEPTSTLTNPDGNPLYRTMVPLVADAACLQCHRRDGFKVGEAIGAVSLEVPLSAAHAAILKTKLTTALLYGISLLVLLLVISLLVLRLSSQLKAAYYHIEQTAREDALTGLPNRRAFREFADMQVALSRRHGWPLTLIMMDIDEFKQINDTYGHPKGDEMLKEYARVIRENIRGSDVPCRWGGEEFIILLVNTKMENAVSVWERLRKLFGDIRVEGVPETRTVTFGVAQFRPDESLEDLVKRADDALLAGKRSGGNTIAYAPESAPSDESPPHETPATT